MMKDEWVLQLVTPFGYRHPQFVSRVRIGAGIWLLILTAVLVSSGGSTWWVLLLGAALCFYLAYREPRAISAKKNSTVTN
jgi:hypothetical protein